MQRNVRLDPGDREIRILYRILSLTNGWEGNVKLQKLEGCWRIERREAEGDRNGGNVGKDPEYIVYLVVCMCMLDGGSQ